MNKKLKFGLMAVTTAVSLMGAGCGSSTVNTSTNAPSTPLPVSSGSMESSGSSSSQTYAMSDVQKHNNATSCWTAINGNVYDVTDWINQHPGGQEAILSLCGTDGSSAFNDQHGGQRRPESELASFKIGSLAK